VIGRLVEVVADDLEVRDFRALAGLVAAAGLVNAA
jgi:hypothetical protein